MAHTIAAGFRHVLVATALLGFAGQAAADEYYYAIEVNGTLCGYARLVTSPISQGGRTLTLLRHEIVMKGTLLGARVDNRLLLTYHLDPVTGAFTYHDSTIEQGSSRLTSAIRVEGRTAHVSDGRGGRETPVELPAGVVLDNTLVHPHLVADFVGRALDRQTYQLFDGRDNAVREVVYTRVGGETVRLGDRSFDTIVLESVDRSTGVNATLWLDTRTGLAVQTRHPGNRRTYLSDAAIVQTITQPGSRADFTPTIMSKANVTIRNVRGLSYMKVRVAARPSGVSLTADTLSVAGQRFTGTVQDHLVEGVFEVAHPRYDGAKAPPFPPDFSKAPSLRAYLEADDLIQADDPVLRGKAREITAGSRDSWEAARRLSAWVAKEIKGAIPGGVTARGTYDQRAGECGGHSFLMAAFSRSVGIPARAVWGCLYTPDGGGSFGQHAWNEVYMGEAGWIPLDTTIGETDYVDSGHLRIGVFQSAAATSLDVRAIEILEHRVSPAPDVTGAAGAGSAGFEAYAGEYTSADRGLAVRVSGQDGTLTLNIPGRAVLSFRDPDADGEWRSTSSDRVFVTFQRDARERVVELRLHQVYRLERIGSAPTPAQDMPDGLRSYPGVYVLPQAQAQFTLAFEHAGLVLHDPLARAVRPLKPSARPGSFTDDTGRFSIWFEKDRTGGVAAMLIDGATVFRR